ncbi:MAG: TonB-dependent receptor [Opitutaceae bacterium]|nr:TonB-dependent receptor [Opitutaceae bacterium]
MKNTKPFPIAEGCRTKSLALVLAVCLPLAAHLSAQGTAASKPAEAESTIKFDPFTVTEKRSSAWNSQQTFSGSRVAENIMNLPVNISIINENFLKDLGAGNLLEALFYAGSGVNSRVSYRDDISIRGFRESPIRDGLNVTSYANTPLYDIERIEVVKGPTALVYSNAANIGGTVNYVTKRPTATPQGDLDVVVGLDNRYGFDITQRGPINASGSVRYRVTGGLQQYDGFRPLEYENNRLASASVDWTVSKDLVFKFDAGYYSVVRRDFTRYLVDPVTRNLANLPDDFTTTSEWSKVATSTYRARIEGVYTPTQDLSARVLVGTFQNDYNYFVPQPTPGLKAAEAPNFLTVGQRLLDFKLKDELRDIQADVVWNREVGPTKNRFGFGFAWSSSLNIQTLSAGTLPDIIIAQPISARPLPSAPTTWSYLLGPNLKAKGSGWTGYVQDSLTLLNDKLILSAGVRYIDASATSNGVSNTVPRYGVVYKHTENLSFYGGYAESYRPLVGFDVFGKPLVDIVGRSQEVGAKLNLFNGRLFGSVAYFDVMNDPVITQVQGIHPVTGLLVFGNAQTAKETNKGIELDIGTVLDVGDGELLVFATLYDADPRNNVGAKPARVVTYKGTLFAKYEFKKGSLKGFSFGGGLSEFGDQIGTGIPLQPGYTLYNALFGYKAAKWGLHLNIDNLGDKKNAIVGSEANFAVGVARPLDARLTFSYEW